MNIEVRVFATLRRYLPELGIGEAKVMHIDPGTTFDELRNRLGLPPQEAKIIMCNNVHVEPDEAIHEGDRIAFIPPIAGG
jgi:molybdopterin converting factor small subunit